MVGTAHPTYYQKTEDPRYAGKYLALRLTLNREPASL